jgi:uncharacterized protein (TIGR02145 family)
MKTKIIIFIFLMTTGLSYAQTGSITNVIASQRTDGSMIVDIYYDLAGSNPPYLITVEASFNGGANFNPISHVSGDVSAGVTTGTGKHIIWNFGTEFTGSYSVTTQVRINAIPNCAILVDARDGQYYNTVQIGTQCWMAENLNIGTMIPGASEMANNSLIEKYCYNDNPANCDVYGGLYQWNEMMGYTTTQGMQGICPTGWHIPTDAEWDIMENFFGGFGVAGGKLKEAGTTHWNAPNDGGTNISGFTALPGGYRSGDAIFSQLGYHAYFRTSTMYDFQMIWYRILYYDYTTISSVVSIQNIAESLRCLKD